MGDRLALGLRQGEALGLQWDHVDLENCTLRVRHNRLRPKYAHRCGGKPCGRKAGYCTQRIRTNEVADETKSSAGRRVLGHPASVVLLLREHRKAQDRDRRTARQLWVERDWVFTSPTGHPLNPNTDYHEWKKLLKETGVREGRLHDARHTAYGSYGAHASRCPRTRSNGCYGMGDNWNGCSLPARDRPGACRHRKASRFSALAHRREATEPSRAFPWRRAVGQCAFRAAPSDAA
jgi:integrase